MASGGTGTGKAWTMSTDKPENNAETVRNRPKLEPGFSYGEDIQIKDLKVGDFIFVPGTPACGQFSGFVKKINRVNIKMDIGGERFGEMVIDVAKDRLIGAYVPRDKIIHKIEG